MFEQKTQNNYLFQASSNIAWLLPIGLLWLVVIVGGLVWLILSSESANPFQEFYLLPWVFLTGIVLAAPSVWMFYKGQFNLFHPLTFASWSYLFPAFFVGGLIFAAGLSQPYFVAFIRDPYYNLPLTLVYVSLGYLGLTVGFYLPFGRWGGERLSKILPSWEWQPDQVLLPGIVLLLIGIANTAMAFVLGIIGFQRAEEIGAFDGLLFLMTLFWLQASFLLWLAIFKTKQLNFNHYLIIVLLLAAALTKATFQGNRGSLLQVFILVVMAFIMSGRKIKWQHGAIGGILLMLALLVGMIYGTTFRNIKGDQSKVGIDQYAENIGKTFDAVTEQDTLSVLALGFSSLGERMDAVSTVAVIVSNYEQLEPYEELYGLDNNILKDSITFFIPRPLWPDKPVASEPHKYSELYFDYGENAFAVTPISDLLRNFGPWGIPIGMLVLGLVLRFIYSALIENQPFSFWKASLYFMLLTSVSYEGFFGTIIPFLIRVCGIAILGIIFVWFFVKHSQSSFIKITSS
jgi:hypothetical protein